MTLCSFWSSSSYSTSVVPHESEVSRLKFVHVMFLATRMASSTKLPYPCKRFSSSIIHTLSPLNTHSKPKAVRHNLVLRSTTLRELKAHTTTRQLLVHLRVSIKSVINTTLLLLIKHNLQDLATVFLSAETLADNLDWVDQVVEDGVVDGRQCSGAGSLLGLRGSRAVASLWAGEDSARGEDQDVTIGELLFEFTSKTGGGDSC